MMFDRQKKDFVYFISITYLITVTCVSGFLFYAEPNLHRLRAALIYRVVDRNTVLERNFGQLKKNEIVPEFIQEYSNTKLNMLNASKGNWEKGLAIAAFSKVEKPVETPSLFHSIEKKLFQIIKSKGVICSDYTEVFIGLCLAGGISVREWGITPDELKGYGGHSLVEVYNDRKKGWCIIDPTVSGWPALKNDPDKPIGLRKYLKTFEDSIVCHPLKDGIFRPDLVQKFYGDRPLSAFIIGDQKIFKDAPDNIPLPVWQAFDILTGKTFHFYVPEISGNDNFVSGLKRIRISIICLSIGTFLFCGYFIFLAIISRVFKKNSSQAKK